MGAALGGGLGRYQGFYGLLADNIVDADLVLADGSKITVSDSSHSDLLWALKGAGHNFGIVTRFTLKTYPSPVQDWYFAQFVFTQDKLESFVAAVNKMMNNGTQPKELMNYFVYAWNPAISTTEVFQRIHRISQYGANNILARYCVHDLLRRNRRTSRHLHRALHGIKTKFPQRFQRTLPRPRQRHQSRRRRLRLSARLQSAPIPCWPADV